MFLLSCFLMNVITAQDTITNTKQTKSFTIKIKAVDLSEDGIPGSTLNDEVFLFVYKQDGKTILPVNIVSEFFVLDTAKRIKVFKLNNEFSAADTLTFLLLEQDTQKQIKGIEPTCRLYLNDLVDIYNKKEYSKFREYFDDDDVLGIWRFPVSKLDLSKPMIKKFETLNFFDWSKYRIELYQ